MLLSEVSFKSKRVKKLQSIMIKCTQPIFKAQKLCI